MEQWKAIQGFENYLVSSLGNIKTVKGNFKKVIYDNKNSYGYVELWKNNKGKKFRIHRLVAETFIPNYANKEQVNHIDGDKTNNCVSNLEWVTPKENIRHAINNNLSSIKYGSSNLASKLRKKMFFISEKTQKLFLVLKNCQRFLMFLQRQFIIL